MKERARAIKGVTYSPMNVIDLCWQSGVISTTKMIKDYMLRVLLRNSTKSKMSLQERLLERCNVDENEEN